MNVDVNAVADQIEGAIRELFAATPSDGPCVQEYAILYNQAVCPTLFIVLFFGDDAAMRTAMGTGLCYWAHCFVMERLPSRDARLPVQIRFAVGSRPSTTNDCGQMLTRFAVVYDPRTDSAGQDTICRLCGHGFAAHQMLGCGDQYPVKGWMTCPEPGCACMLTWDLVPPVSE